MPGDIRKLTNPIHWAAASTDSTPSTTGGPPSSAAATASSRPNNVASRHVLVSRANVSTLSLVTAAAGPGTSSGRTAPATAAAPYGHTHRGDRHR